MTEQPPQEPQGPLPRTREAVDVWLRRWGRDAQAEGTAPLTRDDVERLIAVNGGTAWGLDLSGRDMRGIALPHADLQGTDLSNADLQGADLMQANLQGAHLFAADLQRANLFGADLLGADLWVADLQGAHIREAKLQGADLVGADLQRANLFGADLQGADLRYVRLNGETDLEEAVWDRGFVSVLERQGGFGGAQSSYRLLKTWHQEHGFYDIAGEFHLREWVSRRKEAQQEFIQPLDKNSLWAFLKSLRRARWPRLGQALGLHFYEQLFGYGERPWRVARAAVVVILGMALAYQPYSGLLLSWGGLSVLLERLGKALYFSAVSFTSLGYGDWVKVGDIAPVGWTRYLGVVESFLGVFLIALFLVTFTRKTVR